MKYEPWFDFFLALFMSRYKCAPKVTFSTTLKSGSKTWLALKDDFSRSYLSHIHPLINKPKKKSNRVSYLVSIHLIYVINEVLYIPLSYIKECRCLKNMINQIVRK